MSLVELSGVTLIPTDSPVLMKRIFIGRTSGVFQTSGSNFGVVYTPCQRQCCVYGCTLS